MMAHYPFDINHFYFEQAGEGPPIIFINGFTLDTRMWDNQWRVFQRQYNCMRYDMRGYGRSNLLKGMPNHLYAHYEDLHLIINELNLAPAILIGLSLGGRVAMQCTLEYPDDVCALVLLDTAIDGYPWHKEYLDWVHSFEAIFINEGIEEARKQWLAGALFASAMSKRHLASDLKDMLNTFPGYQWTSADPSYTTPLRSYNRLENIKCPVLTLVGENDLPDFIDCANEIKKKVKQSTKVIIPDAGHCSNMENPELVNQLILEWLTQVHNLATQPTQNH